MHVQLPSAFSFWLVAIALLHQSCLIQRVDRTPYTETAYYHHTKKAVARLAVPPATEDTLQAGWAKVSITAPAPAPLAGYGNRKKKQYTAVRDSAWVRALVFRAGSAKAAVVAVDLLLVPMEVTAALRTQLPILGYDLSTTYLSATHSHSGPGGWGRRLVGRLIAGKYSKAWVRHYTAAILEAIGEAERQTARARLSYMELDASPFVYNRLLGEAGTRDTLLRVLQVEKETGERAILCSFSAHATCLGPANHDLSGDYPGVLVRAMEQDPRVTFAAFAAGAVGSHGPRAPGDGAAKMENLGLGLANLVVQGLEAVPLRHQQGLRPVALPLELRSPHWRIAQEWRVRPWLFNSLFGKYPAQLTALQLGDLVLVGTPCDFSGELLPDLQRQAHRQGQHLMVTSFNGGYLGYITPDSYYDLKKYETRDMNLFGPGNGSYLTELIGDLLQKLAN